MPAPGPEWAPNPDVHPLEAQLNMGFYATHEAGVSGRLRDEPEDFHVREDSAPIAKAHEDGKYTLARIQARNWETHRLMRELSHRLGIPERSIYFTGTKDKRAVTTQNLAIAAGEDNVRALDLKGVKILETYRVDRAPKLGEHTGNRFTVTIRHLDASPDDVRTRVEGIQETLLSHRGFPNFFGPQRFGSIRPITHLVGREIAKGDIERAVWTYIAYPTRFDPPNVREDREKLWETRDIEQAQAKIPKRFDYEHQMLRHLADNPGDHEGALTRLPLNMTRLFVAAYQSWMFNRILTRRAEEHPLWVALEGDILHPANEDGTPNPDRFIPVTSKNLERCQEATRQGKGFPTAGLLGFDTEQAQGLQGEIEAGVLDEEPVDADAFRILDLPKLSMSGTRRAMWCPLDQLEATVDEDDRGLHVTLDFFLPKGSYATCLLREFMKTDPARY